MIMHWLITSGPHVLKRPCIRIRHRLRYSTGPNGCIFIHIPKCAGISISKSLFGRVGPGHVSMRDYSEAFDPDELSLFFKFTFVRNPWDRLASAYYFLKTGGITFWDARFASRHLAPFDSFEQFVLRWVTPDNVIGYWHFMPQTSFFCDEESRALVDFVGYFEHLDDDFAQVCRRLGLVRSLARLNRTPRPSADYRDLYTPAMRRTVEDVYGRDITVLGYDFESTRPVRRAADC